MAEKTEQKATEKEKVKYFLCEKCENDTFVIVMPDILEYREDFNFICTKCKTEQ